MLRLTMARGEPVIVFASQVQIITDSKVSGYRSCIQFADGSQMHVVESLDEIQSQLEEF